MAGVRNCGSRALYVNTRDYLRVVERGAGGLRAAGGR